MARVYVSHASDDLAVATVVQDWLLLEQHEVFLDQDQDSGIRVGELWRDRLYRELRAADAVLCVITSAYLRSQWCAAEIAIADVLGSRLLPLRVESNITSALLDDRQYVDYGDGSQWRDKLAAALRGVDAAGGLGWPEEQSPFPGLRPFDVGMARFFRGRAEEVRRLTGRLRRSGERPARGLLLVVGPSGCGKSSLVRAGLLARIAGEPGWEVVPPFVPGVDPVGALARGLTTTAKRSGLSWTIAETRRALESSDGLGKLAEELLVTARGPTQDRLLLLIDQGEELFTRCDPASCGEFAALLGRAVTGPVRAVLTLRSEYQDQLLALPDLAGVVDAFVLQPLSRAMLRVVVEEPARIAGLTIERELVDRLIADTDSGDALPLLAFTLNQLADGLTRGGSLSMEKYDRIGGVRGALAKHADEALARAMVVSGLTGEQVLAGLVRLAHLDQAGRRARRRIELADLPDAMEAALGVFVDKRLLTTSRTTTSRSVHVAHEALLTAWPPLDTAINEQAAALHAVGSVEQAAAEWQAGGRAEHFLWDANRLAATEATLGLDGGANGSTKPPTESIIDVEPDAHAFLDASRRRVEAIRRRERRRRGRVIAVLSMLLAVAVAAAGLAGWQRTDAVNARHLAEEQRNLEASRKFAQEALVLRDNKPRISLALSILAFDLAPTLPEARDSLLSAQANYYDATLLPEMGPVHALAISPDNSLLATAQHNNAVGLWRMPDRVPLPPLSTESPIYHLAFSPDGTALAAAGQDGSITLWETQKFERIAHIPSSSGPVNAVSFSPNGRLLAGAGQDGTVTLWDAQTFEQVERLPSGLGPDGPANAVTFNPTNENIIAVATATDDGAAGIAFWDLMSHSKTTVAGFTGPVRSIAFSPDGERLATGSDTGSVTIWNSETHVPIVSNAGYADAVRSVAFSPDGRTLATGSDDASVRLWDTSTDLSSLRLLASLTGPTDSVVGVAFSPDGRLLLSASSDSTVGLWTVSGPPDPNLPEIRNGAVFAPGGVLATAGRNQTPLLWDIEHDSFAPEFGAQLSRVKPPSPGPAQAFGMAISPDGRVLAAPVTNGPMTLWDLESQEARTLSGQAPSMARVAFSADGNFLVSASASVNGKVEIWDTRTRQRVNSFPSVHGGRIKAIAASPDPSGSDAIVATGGDDGIVAVTDLRGSPPKILYNDAGKPVEALAFRHDGTVLAVGSENGIVQLWTFEGRQPERIHNPMKAPTAPALPIVAISFSPDGTVLASASADGVVRLWDVATGELIATLTGRSGTTSVAFPPDGGNDILATSDQDGTPILWDTNPYRVKSRLCSGPPLVTSTEWSVNVPGEPYWRVC